MSFIPALKYLIVVPFAGLVFITFNSILLIITPLGEETDMQTVLLGLWAIGIPLLILFVAGIRSLIQYQKTRYRYGGM